MSTLIYLKPVQSVLIHGWLSPKRILSWGDISDNIDITVSLLYGAGITQEDMIHIQPDIHEWISLKKVSYMEVPMMTKFPLHPIKHLHGNISNLVEYRYPVSVLVELGFTYLELRSLHMDDNWMKAMNLTFSEWLSLGMKMSDVYAMNERTCFELFGKTRSQLIVL
jgi:hypothetical protein